MQVTYVFAQLTIKLIDVHLNVGENEIPWNIDDEIEAYSCS